MTPSQARTRRPLASSPFAQPEAIPSSASRMEVGSRVTHDRLGLGRVVRMDETLDVVVDFGMADGSHRRVRHTTLTVL